MKILHLGAVAVALSTSGLCPGAVIEFTNRSAWEVAAGEFTTIDFTSLAEGTLLNNQYASSGIHFIDGNDFSYTAGAFVNDGAGYGSLLGTSTVAFDSLQASIAADHPGPFQIQLYLNSTLLYTSSEFPGSGAGFFAGLVSTEFFNRAVLIDPAGATDIDDLHFGPPIPAPGALALMGFAALFARRPRRSIR